MRHGLACWKCWSGLSTVWVLRLIFSIQREPNRPASVVLFYAVGNSTVHLNLKTRSKEVEFTLALTHGTSLLSNSYDKHRFSLAGKPIGEIPGGGCWKAVLEGIQSDQDYLRLMFNLKRGPNTQLICHYCDSVQWVSTKSAIGPLNNAESLYTVYGPREGDCKILHKDYGRILV